MIDQIQLLRASLNDRVQHTNLIAIEMNTSCPNIPSHPPPAYSPDILRPLLRAFADAFKVDPTLTLGLKLAPFVYRKQQQDILDLIAEFTEEGRNPIAFLTCTNTLGNCTMFLDQTSSGKASDEVSAKALPTQFGGLAGEPLHYLSLGHVSYLLLCIGRFH
jgi:dihydroorotate dehydrogenase (fumarate)